MGLAIAVLLTPAVRADSGQRVVDETKQLVDSGVRVGGFHAVEIGGILLLRGETTDPDAAAAAAEHARALGYTRVANLIRIVDEPDDVRIERVAERKLATRPLDGCTFKVDSNQGVVTVGGTVKYELQKDLALSILRNIDGVRAVYASLAR